MLINKCKLLLFGLVLFNLFSCAQTPTHIKLEAVANVPSSTQTFNNQQSWQIDSQDLRVARHLIEIVNGDDVATLINEQDSLRLLIQEQLTSAWKQKQLNTTAKSNYEIDVQLVKALASVTESTVSYQVDSNMMIKIKLQHQQKTFVKLFRSSNQWESPFSANIADINEKLNMQLSQLLGQIIQDQELHDKLNQF